MELDFARNVVHDSVVRYVAKSFCAAIGSTNVQREQELDILLPLNPLYRPPKADIILHNLPADPAANPTSSTDHVIIDVKTSESTTLGNTEYLRSLHRNHLPLQARPLVNADSIRAEGEKHYRQHAAYGDTIPVGARLTVPVMDMIGVSDSVTIALFQKCARTQIAKDLIEAPDMTIHPDAASVLTSQLLQGLARTKLIANVRAERDRLHKLRMDPDFIVPRANRFLREPGRRSLDILSLNRQAALARANGDVQRCCRLLPLQISGPPSVSPVYADSQPSVVVKFHVTK